MEYVQLRGTEEVRTAGYAMERAGDQIQRSASQIDEALQNHRIWMESWLERFESAVRRLHAPDDSSQ